MIGKTFWNLSSKASRSTGLRFVTNEEIQKYKTDSSVLAQWLDVSIVSRKGRAFDASSELISKAKADTFPMTKVNTLSGQVVTIPDHVDAKAKLIVFSFKHYGFTLLRSWIDPFIAKYNVAQLPDQAGESTATNSSTPESAKKALSNPAGAVAYEICFVEYGFLSMAKGMFAQNIKQNINASQVDRTGLVFGKVKVIIDQSALC